MQTEVEKAIAATLPKTEGQRHRRLFDLARHLKAIPELANAGPDQLRSIIQVWHETALPVIGTKPFADTWADFVGAWLRVKTPMGLGVIEMASKRAKDSNPLVAAVQRYGEGPIILLASLCRELQDIAGPGSEFFLSCRTAGQFLGIDHSTASRHLAILVFDGFLAPGEKGSAASGKATRFRFIAREAT